MLRCDCENVRMLRCYEMDEMDGNANIEFLRTIPLQWELYKENEIT